MTSSIAARLISPMLANIWSVQPSECGAVITVSSCRIGSCAGGGSGSNTSIAAPAIRRSTRSEEHTYELQSLMRNTYAVFWLETKKEAKSTNNPHKQNNKP